MARGVQLQRSQIETTNFRHIRGFRIRIEAVAANNMPKEIFVYSQRPPNSVSGVVENMFETVASFPDISEYPTDAPTEGAVRPFFRLNYVELDCRSEAEAEFIWDTINTMATNLAEAMDRADTLTVTEAVWCGEST